MCTAPAQSPFQSPSPRKVPDHGDTLAPGHIAEGTNHHHNGSSPSPDGGTALSYSHYAAASPSQGGSRGYSELGPSRRSRSSYGGGSGLADIPRPPAKSLAGSATGRRAMRRILTASLSSEDASFGSRDGVALEGGAGGMMMAMSLAVPTPLRGGARRHGMHRVRARHHTGVKVRR